MVIIRIIIYLIILAAIAAGVFFFFIYSNGNQAHPDAPAITFLTDKRSDDGLPLYNGSVLVELSTGKRGKVIIQLESSESYQRRLNNNMPVGRQGGGIVMDANHGKFEIPLSVMEKQGDGRYWLRSGVFCGERDYNMLVRIFMKPIDERSGFMVLPEETDSGVSQNAYCVGKYQPFVWQKPPFEAIARDLDPEWTLSNTELKAGAFEFLLPVGFEPISIIQSTKDQVNNLENGKLAQLAGAQIIYMYGYESLQRNSMVIFYGSKYEKPIDRTILLETAKAKINKGQEIGHMDDASAVSETTLAEHPAVFSEITYPTAQGSLYTYELLVSEKSDTKHTLAIVYDGEGHLNPEFIEPFIESIKIKEQF